MTSRLEGELPESSLRLRRYAGYEGSRSDVQAHVPRGVRRILELGCSTGALGSALKQRQNVTIVGVEISSEYAVEAESRLDRVVVADVATFLQGPVPPEAPFDCLIAADVLEHLVDPWTVLEGAVDLLSPRATVVVSLPNVLYWRGILRVLRTGSWPRDDQGVFDRTHLRWFTRNDALALLRQCRLRPLAVEPRYGASGWRLLWRMAAARTPLDRFLAPQYIISAVKE